MPYRYSDFAESLQTDRARDDIKTIRAFCECSRSVSDIISHLCSKHGAVDAWQVLACIDASVKEGSLECVSMSGATQDHRYKAA